MKDDPKPFLVQRLLEQKYPDKKKGVDREFDCDYMGSAEFEFGALPHALKAMREQDHKEWKPTELTFGIYSVWYVGPPALKKTAEAFFKEQMTVDYPRLKEASYMKASLTGKDRWGERDSFFTHTVGWWCVDPGLAFCLFKTKEFADKWLSAM